ncbi:MAG: phosphoribosylglycinamide formyltransferase [Steroidobacteraceae bacterium]
MNGAAASPLAVAVLVSGRGSNMAAIARSCANGDINARIVRVIADRPSAAGIELAQELGLKASVVPARQFADRSAFEAALQSEIEASGARLVVLAGFMRILSEEFAARHAGAMLNIHPSLLPNFTGLHTHERVLAAGESEHGASVHFVTATLDGGPLLRQVRVPVLPGDTPESLSARVQAAEHIIYPEVIRWIADGRLQLIDGMPRLDGRPLLQPVVTSQEIHQ